MLLLYVDPGTTSALFAGFSTLLAALSGGAAVVIGLFFRPVRRFIGGLWRAVRGTGHDTNGALEEDS